MRKQVSLAAATEQSEGQIVRMMAVPPGDSSSTVLALIERVALDPSSDVEKLDRMMAMYEQLKAKEAELAYNAAKGRILKELAGISGTSNGGASSASPFMRSLARLQQQPPREASGTRGTCLCARWANSQV